MSNYTLQLFTPIFTLYQKWSVWNAKRIRNEKWKKAYDEELALCEPHERTLYKSLVDNQYQQMVASVMLTKEQNDDSQMFTFRVGCSVARQIMPLRHVVGIQPLSSPCGLVFQLELRKDEDGNLSLSVNRHAITDSSKRLRTTWSLETFADMYTASGVDVYNEVVQALSQEIASEIASSLINDIRNLGHREGEVVVGSTGVALSVEINKRCNSIAVETRRGVGNVVVLSPKTLVDLQQNNPALVMFDEYQITGNAMLQHVGTLNGTIKVLTSIHVQDEVIVGFRGDTDFDAGYIYSPYVLVINTGVVVNPNTFEPQMTMIVRDAKWTSGDESEALNKSEMYYRTFTPASIGTETPVQDPVVTQ